MAYKTPAISDGMGKTTDRPKGQDIKPKVFQFPATFMIQMFETPTERRLLWMIYHYPYMLNAFFLGDLVHGNPKMAEQDSKLGQTLKILHTLKMKGYVYQSKDLLKWHLTFTGKMYRITSHSGWPAIPVLVATIVAFTIFGLNKGCSRELAKDTESTKSTNQISDSVKYNPVQTAPLKVKDSSLIDSGKTKTNLVDTK